MGLKWISVIIVEENMMKRYISNALSVMMRMIEMDEFTGIKYTPVKSCKLCGFISTKLWDGMCYQCYIGEVDDKEKV